MRPLELELAGFTCFRTPTTVDFRELDLFAITGPTGSGKSSLLDAMIYALYGRAPRLRREINQLVSRGLDRMKVRLDFQVGKAVYRVVRSSVLAGGGLKTQTVLEEQSGTDFRSVAGKSGEVEAAITEAIGLDYDSFIRSVVLPQGEFDLFLNGEPRERQKILHHLLKLGIYGDMQRLAHDRGVRQRAAAEAAAARLEELAHATPETLAARQAEVARLSDMLAAHAAREESLARAEEIAQALKALLGEARQAEAGAERLTAAIAKDADELRAIAAAEEKRAGAIAAIEAALRTLAHDEERHLALEKAEGDAEQWRRIAAASNAARTAAAVAAKQKAELAKLEAAAAARAKAAEKARTAQVALRDAARKHAEELGERWGSHARIVEHLGMENALRKARAARVAREEAMVARGTLIARHAAELAQAQDAATVARTEAASAEEALALLRRQHAAHELRTHLVAGEPCPVCEQAIAAPPRGKRGAAVTGITAAERALREHRKRAEEAAARATRLEAEHASEVKRRDELGREADALRTEEAAELKALARYLAPAFPQATPDPDLIRAALTTAEAEVEKNQRALTAAEGAVAAAEREAGQAEREREALARELATLEARRADEERAEAERAAATLAIEDRLRALCGAAADPVAAFLKALDAARAAKREADARVAERAAIETAGARAREQAIAIEAAKHEKEAQRSGHLAAADQARESAAQKRRALARDAEHLDLVLAESATGERELAAVTEAQTALARAHRELAAARAVAERAVAEIATQIEERAALAARAARAAGTARLHFVLDQDLQRDGFPAYLLEEALARLATDANRHLRNFAHPGFSLAVDGQDFAVIDHANADERRSVRTLSGGESFIAALSLAMAFAESLAALAGPNDAAAVLDSLFLDEGFGTLDTENLDAVAGALEALYGRERMVGVITHLPELAQRLPARIVVAKRGNASEVRIDSG
jgi:exonuclease SbcC